MNVVSRVMHFGRTRAAAAALVDGGRIISYGTLADLTARTAQYLASLGVRRGQWIGLCLKDTADHLIALLGSALMGAVPVPLDWRARARENARLVKALDLPWLLSEPTAMATGSEGTIRLDDAWHRGVARARADAAWAGDWHDPFLISASSGSTGTPTFTMMTHLQYHFAMTGMLELMELAGHHKFLCTLPLYYSGGRNSCLAHLLRGDCVELYPNLYSPAEYVELVARRHITVAVMVPTGIRQLLDAAGDAPLLPNLSALFCTGAPLHIAEKLDAARRLTPQFHERYGTAETLAVSVLHPEDFTARGGSVGQPHSLVELDVVDADDRSLPDGEAGILRIRGPGMASPVAAQTEQRKFRGGWYYPGEIARMDADGYLFMGGRTSDVIMRNGAKVYPAEVEGALMEHPGILEAAVLGVLGSDNEERVVAFVVPAGNIAAGALIAHCRTRLTAHKVPAKFHFLADLPKNTAGKIDRAALYGLLARFGAEKL